MFNHVALGLGWIFWSLFWKVDETSWVIAKTSNIILGVIRKGPMEWEIIEAWAKVVEDQDLCQTWRRKAQKQAFQQREVLQDVDKSTLAHEIRRGT
jgi:hypothetical protein